MPGHAVRHRLGKPSAQHSGRHGCIEVNRRTGMKSIELTDGQRRHWRSTFAYIDERLAEAERRLDPSSPPRPFAAHIADGTPLQASVIRDYAARVRAEMSAALARAGIEPLAPRTSAVGSARSQLRAAAIAAEELGARSMRDYGPVGDDLAREVNLTSAALIDLLDDMDRYLALSPRWPPLEFRGRDPLPALARAIRAHGLSELRGALNMLLERRRAPMLEVAFFGRVNCGKSSLINFILGTDALPVGPRPITGVPIRIVQGPIPEGRAWFVDAQAESFDLARLAEFADIHYNPGNRRHVSRLQIATPAPFLVPGVAMIDTPGYGALGAGETAPMACDVGIVLLDAGAAPTAADAALVDALARSGAHVLVVLAKADQLSAEGGVLMSSHAQSALHAATRRLFPVHLVSVKGAAASLAGAWVEQVLRPCLQERERYIEQSIACKTALLQDETVAALERRLAGTRGGVADASEIADAQTALRDALARFDRLRARQDAVFEPVEAIAEQIVAQAAYNAAVIWQADFAPTIDVTPLLAASLAGRAGSAAAAIERRIASVRAALANALEAARAACAGAPEVEELPHPPEPPTLDVAASITPTTLARSALLPPIRAFLAHSVRRRLRRLGLQEAVAAALVGYEVRLAVWRSSALDAIGHAFGRQAGRVGAHLKRSAAGASGVSALRAEIERLRSPMRSDCAHAVHAPDRLDAIQTRR